MTKDHPFKWRHFEGEIILLCVRWYLRYFLSYRDLEEMMFEWGLTVDHSTIYRWFQIYAPELDKRCKPHQRPTNDSYRVDETYIIVKGQWRYLCRAVDSEGNTIEYMLSVRRDAKAAKLFFKKVLKAFHSSNPRVINVDKNAAYPPAISELKEDEILPKSCELRQVKYLNNIIEQDHRFMKRRVAPGLGFASFQTPWRTLRGYEAMNMIRKGQIKKVGKEDIRGQVRFIENLFKIAA